MASNEIEVLDPAATVEKLKKIAAGRALNRRHFMAALGMTGAAAGAGLLSGCSAQHHTPASPLPAPAQSDYLNFALNLEYLEATFYSYITQGTDLPSEPHRRQRRHHRRPQRQAHLRRSQCRGRSPICSTRSTSTSSTM